MRLAEHLDGLLVELGRDSYQRQWEYQEWSEHRDAQLNDTVAMLQDAARAEVREARKYSTFRLH